MTGLPEIGEKVRVWVRPGRKAHVSHRPVDAAGGGRFIAESEIVEWSMFHLTQLRCGDIMLQDPKPTKAQE